MSEREVKFKNYNFQSLYFNIVKKKRNNLILQLDNNDSKI